MSVQLTIRVIEEDRIVETCNRQVLAAQVYEPINAALATAGSTLKVWQEGRNVYLQFVTCGMLVMEIICMPLQAAADRLMQYISDERSKRVLC